MPPDREPTQDELLSMAYADGELAQERRLEFEGRLASEPTLAREVAEYQALQLLARHMAPPEPADYEWERLAQDPLQRMGNGVGWLLFVVGGIGLGALGVWRTATSELEVLPKSLTLAAIAGIVVLFLLTVRGRLRTLPFDPYTKVKR